MHLRPAGQQKLRMGIRDGRMYAFEWDAVTDAIVRSPESAYLFSIGGTTHDEVSNLLQEFTPTIATRMPLEGSGLLVTVPPIKPAIACYGPTVVSFSSRQQAAPRNSGKAISRGSPSDVTSFEGGRLFRFQFRVYAYGRAFRSELSERLARSDQSARPAHIGLLHS